MKKLKRLYVLLAFFCPLLSKAQGIQFENGETWSQIQTKAKKEQKYIFVDCYTTWCGPCKVMDKEVYPNDTVGQYMNDKFLSVRIQMDKTDVDNEEVKKWYGTANDFAQSYTINAYPSYLFFSPDGQPLHKSVGMLSASSFIELAKDAQNPQKQYYSILKNYKPGTLDTAELAGLSRSLVFTDKKLAATLVLDYLQRTQPDRVLTKNNIDLIKQLSRDEQIKKWSLNYIQEQLTPEDLHDSLRQSFVAVFNHDNMVQQKVMSYLGSLSKKKLEEKNNLLLMVSFVSLIHVNDRYFNQFYKKEEENDATMELKGQSRRIVDYIIYYDLVADKMKVADSADVDMNWDNLYETIKNKTDADCAKRNIISNKVRFYRTVTRKTEMKNSEDKWKWGKLFAEAVAVQEETAGFGRVSNNISEGNDLEFSIYRYCNDQRIINEALGWLAQVMRDDPGTDYSYVYAGLLYKSGKTEEAKAWQQMTVQILAGRCYEAKKDPLLNKSYLEQKAILDKMKRKEKFENLIRWDAEMPL